jgi:hypothetical protein
MRRTTDLYISYLSRAVIVHRNPPALFTLQQVKSSSFFSREYFVKKPGKYGAAAITHQFGGEA